MVSLRCVIPLHAWVLNSKAQNKFSSSVVISILDAKCPCSVLVVSNMAGVGIEDPNFSFIVFWSSDLNLVLVTTNFVVVEENSSSTQRRSNEERLSGLQVGTLVDRSSN